MIHHNNSGASIIDYGMTTKRLAARTLKNSEYYVRLIKEKRNRKSTRQSGCRKRFRKQKRVCSKKRIFEHS